MIIIRNNLLCSQAEHDRIARCIIGQAKTGFIVLPHYCEVLLDDSESGDIEITKIPEIPLPPDIFSCIPGSGDPV